MTRICIHVYVYVYLYVYDIILYVMYTYTPINYNTVYIVLIRHCKHLLVVVYESLSCTDSPQALFCLCLRASIMCSYVHLCASIMCSCVHLVCASICIFVVVHPIYVHLCVCVSRCICVHLCASIRIYMYLCIPQAPFYVCSCRP